MTSTSERIKAGLWANHALGVKGDSADGGVIARETLHDELGYNGPPETQYDLDQGTRDILLAHARQDAAHALCNSIALLKRVKELTRAVYLLGSITIVLVLILLSKQT
ncbi:hypothetical protein MKK64_17455 [Methylobacterium sp. E-025]|uniref:hypothetical protein n=1 Tax=Methylobacterium sp. E-025 TaxID=2836561 RepID=UPI001FB8FD12|nr:hypothetical protein [Methylobacterium sp. E-025]MCJ2112970.1 hypothetical protein [Methylobacterium sp. E-025]